MDSISSFVVSLISRKVLKGKQKPPAAEYDLPPLQKMLTKTTSRVEFFDVQFLVEKKVIVAHRVILADRSEVFRKMFLWNENNPHKKNEPIPIVDTSYDCFSNFINAIYYGTTPADSEMCLEMIKLAERYDVQDIKTDAEGCVIESIGEENVIQILIMSELHKACKIKQAALEFCAQGEMHEMKDIKELANYPDLMIEAFKQISVKRNSRYRPY